MDEKQSVRECGQRGNILFLILLAVVLFAALSYAVTQSLRGGGKNASTENASVAAAQIVQSAHLIEQAALRLSLTNGCNPLQYSFANGVVAYSTNPNTPSDKRCHLFDPAGGGLSWPSIPSSFYDSNFVTSGAPVYGNPVFNFTSITNVGTDCPFTYDGCTDLVMIVPFIKQNICLEINKANGFNYIPRVTGQIQLSKYTGDYVNGTNNGGNQWGTGITGRTYFCAEGNNQLWGTVSLTSVGSGIGTYHYFHVLIAR